MRRMDGYLGLCEWLEFLYIHILSTNVSLKDCKNGFFWVEGGKDHSHPPPKKGMGYDFIYSTLILPPQSQSPFPKKTTRNTAFLPFFFSFSFSFFSPGDVVVLRYSTYSTCMLYIRQ